VMAHPVNELSDHGSRRKFGIEFQRSCGLTSPIIRLEKAIPGSDRSIGGKTVAMLNKIPLEGSFLLNSG
jgi:hypothetical protein